MVWGFPSTTKESKQERLLIRFRHEKNEKSEGVLEGSMLQREPNGNRVTGFVPGFSVPHCHPTNDSHRVPCIAFFPESSQSTGSISKGDVSDITAKFGVHVTITCQLWHF